MKITKKWFALLPALPLLLSLPVCACGAVFFHRAAWFGAALCLLGVWYSIIAIRRGRGVLRLLSGIGVFVVGVFALFICAYFWVLLLFSLAFLFAVWGAVRLLLTGTSSKTARACKSAALLVLTLVFAAPLVLGWDPDPLFRYVMQGDVMAHTPQPADRVRADRVREIRDLVYPSAYPNNTMDLYLSPGNRGTLFYIHGGGFVLGDKRTDAQTAYLEKWIGAGYNVAAVDYALAPQYRVQTQIVQCSEALQYFLEHAEDWGLDRNRVILLGDSAGGCLSGLLLATGVSPAAADALGIPAAASFCGGIRGWISVAGLVDVPRFGDTNDDLSSWAFNLMGVCAFHDPAYAVSGTAARFSVFAQATADFPPVYLSDGNAGTFTEQGEALARKLRALGVSVETNFVPVAAGVRSHDFELNVNVDPLAAENFEKTLAFAERILR